MGLLITVVVILKSQGSAEINKYKKYWFIYLFTCKFIISHFL
jgi:hypothetical protein